MTLYLLLLASLVQNDPLILKADAYLQQSKAMSVDYVAALDKRAQTIKGSFRIQGDQRLRFDATAEGIHYSLCVTEEGTFELDRDLRLYETFPWEGKITLYKSDLMLPRRYIAPFLLNRSVSRLVPSRSPFKKVGPGDNGATRFQSEFQVDHGMVRYQVDVATDGSVGRVRLDAPGQLPTTWVLTNYRSLTQPKISDFALDIPLGYTPYVLPRDRGPVTIGEKIPSGQVQGRDGRKQTLANLIAGKRTLLVCLGDDCLPSQKLADSLSRLRTALGSKASLVTLYQSNPKDDGLTDPTGKLWDALILPATPLCFLVDSKGKVEKLWMGFDPDSKEGVLHEVGKALEEGG